MSGSDPAQEGSGLAAFGASPSDVGRPLANADEGLRQRLQAELTGIIPSAAGQDGKLVERISSIALRLVQDEYFTGPLPHPRDLRDYDAVFPGAAERILAMAEKEQNHRHGWEDRTLLLDFIYSTAGLALGSMIAAGLVAGAYSSAAAGHDAVAAVFLATSAVGMVPAFVRGRDLFRPTAAVMTRPDPDASKSRKITAPHEAEKAE